MNMFWDRTLRALCAGVAALVVAACGGGDGEPTPPPAREGSANVGPSGGLVRAADGAEIVVPAGARVRETTVTLARDSTHAPAVPLAFAPVGQTWALTPHGTRFAEDVTVRIPFDTSALAAGERVALLKAEPGGAWHVIDDVLAQDGFVIAKLRSFSFIRPVRVTGSWYATNPQQPTEAQFSLELSNPTFPALVPASGTAVRIRQQQESAEPALLRVRFTIPATSSLATGSTCNASTGAYLSVRLVTSPATLFRVPGDTGSRIAVDSDNAVPEYLGNTFGGADAQVAQDRTINVLDFAPYLTAPQINPLWVRDRIPAGAIIDAHAVHVALKVFCWSPSGQFELPAPVTPIVIGQGFAPAEVYVSSHPAAPTAEVGQPFTATFNVRAAEGGWEFDSADWQVSDTNGTNFTTLQDPPTNLDGSLRGGEYGFFGRRGSNPPEIPPEMIGRGLLADNGRLLRGTACLRLRANTTYKRCATTRAVPVTITPVPLAAPRFIQQPASALLRVGQTLHLVAGWEATPAPRVVLWEWRASSAHPWQIARATNPTTWGDGVDRPFFEEMRISNSSEWRGNFTLDRIAPLTLADNGMQLRVSYANDVGNVNSDVATITVVEMPQAPVITTEPRDATTALGSAVTLAAAANGTAPLSYQWMRDGAPLGGANAPTLTIDPANGITAGSYQLEVSNGAGTVRTRAARLTVTPAAPPTLTAPTLDAQPAALTVATGSAATFAVTASGSAPLAYEWRRNGAAIPGANGPVLMIPSVAAADAADYSVVVSNAAGRTTSRSAALTVTTGAPVPQAPTISAEPVGLAVLDGHAATLAVAASGTAPLTFQWYRDGSALPETNTPVLAIAAARSGNAGNYTVRVSNTAGSVTSRPAGLVVTPLPGAPAIVTQPSAATVIEGAAASFDVATSGNPAPACQWVRNGVAIDGATSCSRYATPATSLTDNGSVINVIVYSAGGVAIGNGAVLTVRPLLPLTITAQPQPQNTVVGGSANFSYMATGSAPLSPVWHIDGTALPVGGGAFTIGACTGSASYGVNALALTNLGAGCNGVSITVFISNGVGPGVSSSAALLTVNALPNGVTVELDFRAGLDLPQAGIAFYGGAAVIDNGTLRLLGLTDLRAGSVTSIGGVANLRAVPIGGGNFLLRALLYSTNSSGSNCFGGNELRAVAISQGSEGGTWVSPPVLLHTAAAGVCLSTASGAHTPRGFEFAVSALDGSLTAGTLTISHDRQTNTWSTPNVTSTPISLPAACVFPGLDAGTMAGAYDVGLNPLIPTPARIAVLVFNGGSGASRSTCTASLTSSGSWSAVAPMWDNGLDTSGNPVTADPAVTMDNNGNALLASVRRVNNAYELATAFLPVASAQWQIEPSQPAFGEILPALEFDGNGIATLLYRTQPAAAAAFTSVYAARRAADGSWGAREKLTPDDVDTRFPRLSVAGNGEVLAMFSYATAPAPFQIFTVRFSGGAWDTPQRLQSQGSPEGRFAVAARQWRAANNSSLSNLRVYWRETDPGDSTRVRIVSAAPLP